MYKEWSTSFSNKNVKKNKFKLLYKLCQFCSISHNYTIHWLIGNYLLTKIKLEKLQKSKKIN